MEPEVTHEPARGRFLARVGTSESRLVYQSAGENTVDFRSTWVDPAMRGRGVGEKLVVRALEWARDEGLRVIPSCWFVDTVLRRHPEFRPLVDGG